MICADKRAENCFASVTTDNGADFIVSADISWYGSSKCIVASVTDVDSGAFADKLHGFFGRTPHQTPI